MAINFITSKDSNVARTLHAKSNDVEIMRGWETGEIIKELLFCKDIMKDYNQ